VTPIVVSVELDASPADVWRDLEQIEHHVEWMADAKEIRFVTEQTRGVGTRFRCRTGIGPITVDDEMEVVSWEPERRMGVRHSGVVTGTGSFELQPLDDGHRTSMTWSEQLDFPWYFGGSLGERIGGQQVMRQIWRRNLGRFKRHVERAR